MPASGASRPEEGAGAGPRQRPSLAEIARVGLLAAIGAGAVFSAGVAFEVGWEEGVLCLLATSALAAASIPLLVRRRSDLFDPIWLVALTVGVGVTGKAFYVCFGPQKRLDFLLLGKEPRDLAFAALVIAAAMLPLSVGYLLGRIRWRVPGRRHLLTEPWSPRRLTAVVGILVVVGLLSFAVFTVEIDTKIEGWSDISSKRFVRVQGSEYRGVHGYLRWGAKQIEIAFYLVLVWWLSSKRRLWSPAGALVVTLAVLASAFPIFTSSREGILFLLLRIFIVSLVIRGEPRLRTVVAAAALGLVVIGTMLAFRRNITDLEAVREHFGLSEVLEFTIGGRHFLDLTKTAHVLDAVPEVVRYQHGRSLVSWLVAPIPRALWPRKPAIGPGRDLGPAVFGTPRGSGVPPGIVAELHLNLGPAGIFFGLFAIGALLRSMLETLRPYFPNRSFVLIFAVMSTHLALGVISHSVAGSTIRLIQEMVPLVLALLACGWAPRHAGRARGGPATARAGA